MRPTSSRQTSPASLVGRLSSASCVPAVHLAHQLAPDFPDGQLYVNLRASNLGNGLTRLKCSTVSCAPWACRQMFCLKNWTSRRLATASHEALESNT
ncbi:MAG: hypothetical protein JWM17_2035 [Actinobacteria bacterium]|nr:hypothetical protein [Actinomycetota bacterium]